jgi:hypothetical protein
VIRSLRLGGIVLVAWGALLLTWAAVLLIFTPTTAEIALLGGAGIACFASGWVLALVERRRLRGIAPGLHAGERRRITDLSMATVVLALGIALLGVGAELGHWLQWIGGGVIVIGFGGLVREFRAELRA